jgi:hypothetical protein
MQHLFLFYDFVYTDYFIITQQNNNNTNSNPDVDNQNLIIENNMVVKNFYCQLNFMIINI